MDKELSVKLTNSEINTLIILVENRVKFFRNELKKQDQLESYVNFCKEREQYYVDLYSKLLSVEKFKLEFQMSWQDDAMADQAESDALFEMGESEWKEMYKD